MATAVSQPPTSLHQRPFIVGRPRSETPLTALATNPALLGRAKTSLGVANSEADKEKTTLTSSTPPANAAFVALTRLRHNVSTQEWPRIVVRDVSGRTLDTFTTLQDAIYRASWTIKTLHQWPMTPLQWRLPKAPVPARPDFSRAGLRGPTAYSLDLTRSYRNTVHSAPVSKQPVVEIDVDDVAFVAESLRLLPELPAFQFLRHSLLAGERTYLRIVGSLLLHQRHLANPDKREAELSFPGFCTGCKRAGFCYGCDKNPRPHVHEDIPMRTGGGFRFFRPDRPLNPHFHKDPRSWVTGDAETDLRHIVDKTGGMAAFERAAAASQHLMTSGQVSSFLPFMQPGFGRVRLLTGPWPQQRNVFNEEEYPSSAADEGIQEEEGEEEEEEEEEEIHRPQTISADRSSRKSVLKKQSSLKSSLGDASEGQRSPSERRSVTIAAGKTRVYASDEEEEEEEDEGRASTRKSRSGRKEDREATGRETEYDSGIEGVGSGSTVTGRGAEGITDGRTSTHPSTYSRFSTLSRPSTLSSPDRGALGSRSRSRSGTRTRSKSPGHSGVAFGGSSRTGRSDLNGVASREKEETPEERQARLENIPFAKKRQEKLYTPPAFFKPVKRNRRITVAKDPFSSDREYHIPQGGTFQLKKGDNKTTKFVNFKKKDHGYKPPPKFELKDNERKSTQFWVPRPKKGDGGKGRRRGHGDDDDDDDEARRRRRKDAGSEDSGLGLQTAVGLGDDNGDNDNDGDDGLNKGEPEPQPEPEPEKKQRKEVVKKERKVVSPPGVKRKPRTPSPPPPPPRQPTPEPPTPSPPPLPTLPLEEPPLPEIDLPDIPDLPEWKEKERAERQKKQKFIVAPPPPAPVAKESPKRRKPPPRVRKPLKIQVKRLKTKPAEAPINADAVKDMQDPLDWLAKYCIINPDRLPLYEMIFEAVIADQQPRYVKPPPPTLKEVLAEAREKDPLADEGEQGEEKGKKKKGKKKRDKSEEKKKVEEKVNPLASLDKSMFEPKVGLSLPEQQLEKLCFTLDTLHHRLQQLSSDLQVLEDRQTKQLADQARELFPQVCAPDYAPKTKKKGKKSKAKSSAPVAKLRPQDITDDVIVSRLDDKMLACLRREQEVRQTELEMERAREKIGDVTDRLQELATEKLLTDAFCLNHFFTSQGDNNRPREFRRQQSDLYNRLRPEPDIEMNMEDLEEALQHINGHLLTQKECYFLYSVLNLPGRSKINFRLFSVVAALSEKVTQLDPVIRKLINNTDLNALDIKMDKCRELFKFLEDEDIAPRGGATADRLAVELTAGGLTPEHTRFVLTKFNREKRGIVDFLDFVTYVPLFILIHHRIISHPLREELDL